MHSKLEKYLVEYRIEEMSKKLEAKGYSVFKEKKYGNYIFDLFAIKDNESILYEFKTKKD